MANKNNQQIIDKIIKNNFEQLTWEDTYNVMQTIKTSAIDKIKVEDQIIALKNLVQHFCSSNEEDLILNQYVITAQFKSVIASVLSKLEGFKDAFSDKDKTETTYVCVYPGGKVSTSSKNDDNDKSSQSGIYITRALTIVELIKGDFTSIVTRKNVKTLTTKIGKINTSNHIVDNNNNAGSNNVVDNTTYSSKFKSLQADTEIRASRGILAQAAFRQSISGDLSSGDAIIASRGNTPYQLQGDVNYQKNKKNYNIQVKATGADITDAIHLKKSMSRILALLSQLQLNFSNLQSFMKQQTTHEEGRGKHHLTKGQQNAVDRHASAAAKLINAQLDTRIKPLLT